MDSFEINKIIAAVLLVALIVIGIGKISDLAFYVNKPEKSAYKVEIPESDANENKKVQKVIEKIGFKSFVIIKTISRNKKVKTIVFIVRVNKIDIEMLIRAFLELVLNSKYKVNKKFKRKKYFLNLLFLFIISK